MIFCLAFIETIYKQSLSIYLLTHCGAQNELQVSLFQLFFVLIFRSWDFHVNYSFWDVFYHSFPRFILFMEWGSSGLIKHCHCVLVWKLNWIFYEAPWWILLFEYYYEISSFSPLNTNVNTTLKYYRKQALSKKLKLMGGAMKCFTKKLLGHEIFSSLIPWATKFFFEKFVKPSGSSSYILNVHSLSVKKSQVGILGVKFKRILRPTDC